MTQNDSTTKVSISREEADLLKTYHQNINFITDQESLNLKKIVLNSINEKIPVHSSLKEYDFENIRTFKYDTMTLVSVSKYNSLLSTLTFTIDSGEITSYIENDVINDNGYFRSNVYENGALVSSNLTTAKYLSNDEVLESIKSLENATLDNVLVGKTRGLDAKCFAIFTGAGAAIIGAILKLCGTPCALTPPVCVACLGGIVAVGAGSIARRCCFLLEMM
ncbi:hypothetical protein ACR31S_09685 [Streptococcus iniae]